MGQKGVRNKVVPVPETPEVVDVGPKIKEIAGFKVLRWRAKKESPIIRDFFIKAHDVPEVTRRKPVGRTLIVLNVPPFVYEDNLRKMFGLFGGVQDVFLHQKPTIAIPNSANTHFLQEKDKIYGHKVAYVVFRDASTLKEVLQLDPYEVEPLILGGILKSGVAKWVDDYNSQIVKANVLEDDVKKFMTEFEKDEVRRKEAEKQSAEADDEGWITVTSQSKRGGTKRTESTQEKLKAKKRRMEKAVLNITPAQIKATKAKQLEELKQKFDEDRQKIALLKQQRKFKPF